MPTAADMAQLGANILASYQGRVAEIGTIRAEVGAHNRQTHRFMGELHRGSQARQRAVEAHHRQTNQLLRQVRQFTTELHRGSQVRKRVVMSQLAGYAMQMAAYALELRGALVEWHRHQAAMGAAWRATTTQPRPKMATERAPRAHAMSKGGDSELAERILTFIAAHPGTRLPAVEEELGVSRIEVGRTIRELMDQGKVRRNDETREYFPG